MITTFWSIVAAAAAVLIAAGLWRQAAGQRGIAADSEASQATDPVSHPESLRDALNVALFRDRAEELEREMAGGTVDPEQAEALRNELGAALLDDGVRLSGAAAAEQEVSDAQRPLMRAQSSLWSRNLPVLATVSAVLIAVLVYVQLGSLDDVELANALRSGGSGVSGEPGVSGEHDGIVGAELLERLKLRLEANPDDTDGWFLLGRTALSEGDFDTGVDAFETLQVLLPDEIAVHIYRVQALYLAAQRQVTPRVQAAADEVLRRQPMEPITLEILAMDAFQKADYRASIGYLERALQAGVPAEREGFLREGLKRSRELAGVQAPSTDPASATQAPIGAGQGLRLSVSASEEVKNRFPPQTPVFVLARPPGGRMPLAVVRAQLQELPKQVLLSDAQAMNPAMPLSSVDEVEVVVRVAASGSVQRSDDDVEVVVTAVPTETRTPLSMRLTQGGSQQTFAQSMAESGVAQGAIGGAQDTGPSGDSRSKTEGSAIAIKVLVELGPGITAPATTPVFVFARAVTGPPMPLAVKRLQASDLPALIELTTADAMMPSLSLATVDEVIVGARLAYSGTATAASGDVQDTSETVRPATHKQVVTLTVDQRIP